jgi:hypothetical protein
VRHAEIVANTEGSWSEVNIKGDPSECEPNAEGIRHAADRECAHYDEYDYGGGCAINARRRAQIRLRTLEWTPTLLDHYWEHGIQGPGVQFLEKAEFVKSYRQVARKWRASRANFAHK